MKEMLHKQMVKLILKMLTVFWFFLNTPIHVQSAYEQRGYPGKIGAIHGLQQYGSPFIKATLMAATAKSLV